MSTVFVLHHVHVLPGDTDDVKLLGVYSSDSAAREAVSRLNRKPGFRDLPNIIAAGSESTEGFHITEYGLDQDVQGWADGYVCG
jgi:hypothetical protein